MRTLFYEQLSDLCALVGDMCGLAADAMEHATHALLQADLSAAEQVISEHARISNASLQAEEAAFKLLALQQPVASDLRSIIGSMHIATDIERMGALAVHVAKIARRRHPECAVPDQVRGCFAEMGTQAVQLARAAQEVLLSRDAANAAKLRVEDDMVDAGHRHLFSVLMDRDWRDGVRCAIDVALLGRFYERYADHAVEIGRRVVFEAGASPVTSAG